MTKLIQLTIVVMLGSLMMSGTAGAVQCERLWAKQDVPAGVDPEREKALFLEKVVVNVEGVKKISSYRFAHELTSIVIKRCPERFSWLPSNRSPFSYLGFNLRNNGLIPNGVLIPEFMEYKMIADRIGGKGFGLFLPTEKAEVTPTKVLKGEILSLSEVKAELNALRSEFDILSKQLNSSSGMEMFIETSINDDMINDIVDRLTELGVLTPQGSTPGSVISELEEMANTIRGGFVAYQNGELSLAMAAAIEEQVAGHVEVLKAADIRHEKQLADHEDRLQGLEKNSKKQAGTINDWQNATSSNYGRIGKLEDDANISGYVDYLFGAAILLILFILLLMDSKQEKLEAFVKKLREFRADAIQARLDNQRHDREIAAIEIILSGDGTKANPGLIEMVKSQGNRLTRTTTVANRADKGLKAIEESKGV